MLTEGRRLFVAAVVASSGAAVSAVVKVSRAYISQLMSGERRPSLDVAIRIEDAFGIPARAWRLDRS